MNLAELIDRELSREEADFYLGLARKAQSSYELARVVWDASGLLEVTEDGIKPAKWLKSKHRMVPVPEGWNVSEELEKINSTEFSKLRNELEAFLAM